MTAKIYLYPLKLLKSITALGCLLYCRPGFKHYIHTRYVLIVIGRDVGFTEVHVFCVDVHSIIIMNPLRMRSWVTVYSVCVCLLPLSLLECWLLPSKCDIYGINSIGKLWRCLHLQSVRPYIMIHSGKAHPPIRLLLSDL